MAPANSPPLRDAELVVSELVRRAAGFQAQRDLLAHRRSEERYPLEVSLPVQLKHVGPAEFRPDAQVWGVNISYSGLGILSQTKMEKGQQFTIALNPHDVAAALLRCRVVWSQPLLDSVWRVGAVFLYDQPVPAIAAPRG